MATWVKVCGVTRVEDARAAFAAGADAIGLNLWPGSRRYCAPEVARSIVAALPRTALAYGVFVDAGRDEIARLVRETGLGGVQLHGGQGPDDACGWDLPVILAVAATSRDAVAAAVRDAKARGEYRLLVDHGSGGGSGLTVDDSLLDGIDLGHAVLAGGLTPRNVAARVARLRPFGVDVAGGVESAPGIKDARAIDEFVRAARTAEGTGEGRDRSRAKDGR